MGLDPVDRSLLFPCGVREREREREKFFADFAFRRASGSNAGVAGKGSRSRSDLRNMEMNEFGHDSGFGLWDAGISRKS